MGMFALLGRRSPAAGRELYDGAAAGKEPLICSAEDKQSSSSRTRSHNTSLSATVNNTAVRLCVHLQLNTITNHNYSLHISLKAIKLYQVGTT